MVRTDVDDLQVAGPDEAMTKTVQLLEKELIVKRHGHFGVGREHSYLTAKRQIASKEVPITRDRIYLH